MHLDRLRYFVTVAEERHFGRAADRLHMSQPPLSQQIKLLEADIGVQLFDRCVRPIALTPAAIAILPDALRLLADSERLDRRMNDIAVGQGGLLRIGFVGSASYETMPAFLRRFQARWTKVDVTLASMTSDQQCDALAGGTIDLGIARTPGHRSGIRASPFLNERLVVGLDADHVLASRDSVSLADIAELALIGVDRNASTSLHVELRAMFDAHGHRYNPALEAADYPTILGLAASGQGLAVVPASVQSFRPPSLCYVPLSDEDATSWLILLSREDETSPLPGRAEEMMLELYG
ncbi:MAG: LysR family transcriptional regulator [Acidimicrobiales bacterium]|jgi:DNA-binding transcriptional LysR family regulator|nr:LysR family transcriptional regulator [Acidimicrobiales bacterium]